MYTDENKRRRSVRLDRFDYASRGFFFVTICTHNKQTTLGRVINYKTQLSALGDIVEESWLAIPQHLPNVLLDEWVITLNHLHGIVIIKYPKGFDLEVKGTACRAPTTRDAHYEKFGKPVSGSLSTIIRSFKSAVTKRVNEVRPDRKSPFWQRNYFEHVIRDEESMNKIRNYIWENPIHWWSDEYNVDGA
jgi:putative transposase